MRFTFGQPLRLAAVALLVGTAACSNSSDTSSQTAQSTDGKTVPGKDWSTTVEATAEGGYRIGNPDAKLKLIEYSSIWCPHCKEFHEEGGKALLSSYVKDGRVSYEIRNFVLNGPDMLATLLVRCDAEPATYMRRRDAFYDRQQEWEMNFINLKEEQLKPLQSLPQDQQMLAYAKAAKLDSFVRPQGITGARFEQCINNKAETDRLTASNNKAQADFNVNGTPTFIINGVTLENTANWATLEPKLKAAL